MIIGIPSQCTASKTSVVTSRSAGGRDHGIRRCSSEPRSWRQRAGILLQAARPSSRKLRRIRKLWRCSGRDQDAHRHERTRATSCACLQSRLLVRRFQICLRKAMHHGYQSYGRSAADVPQAAEFARIASDVPKAWIWIVTLSTQTSPKPSARQTTGCSA